MLLHAAEGHGRAAADSRCECQMEEGAPCSAEASGARGGKARRGRYSVDGGSGESSEAEDDASEAHDECEPAK